MNLFSDIVKKFQGDEKNGLALGGGAVYGAAHIGVLKALEECKIDVDMIAGTSIGAFVATFYAFGMGWKEIEDAVSGLDWMDISQISLTNYGLLSNKRFGEQIKKHIGDVTFDEAKIPLAMIATDITNGEAVILKEGSVADAVTASTCIPGVFKPVTLGKRMLVDGGIVENVPVTPLINMHADQIIAVDLNTTTSEKPPSNILEVLLNSFHFTMMNATIQKTKSADILLTPDLSKFNRYDTKQVKDLIEKGYEDSMRQLKKK